MKKIVVLGSGNGSNFEAIVKYFNGNTDIVCISNNKDAFILARAKELGIKNFYIQHNDLHDFFKKNHFDLAVLAGYMRIISPEVLNLCDFINIHPSLLPDFKGKNAIKQAYDAGVNQIGVTIHRVTNLLDGGSILKQVVHKVKTGISYEELEEEIHNIEHQTYPQVIESILQEGFEQCEY
ncbi:MAG: formyltransferase family protein [Candidatus Gastranaerophilales bacterium]|nr:formyltransferase family protein [Candidatus Gastranaerophilales bacterium]